MKAQFMTPVVTALHQDGTLDLESNKRVYDHLLAGGVDGIVVMGSTGEFFSMTMDMQKQLIDLAASYIMGRTRVFIGVSRMIAAEAVELANYACAKGLKEVMIVSPYYFKLTEASIEAYFSAIASQTEAHIFLYNFPDRTGYDLNPNLVLRLAGTHRNIVGIKDTVTEMGHTSAILRTVLPEHPAFEVFSGYDENLVHNVMSGGAGVIGGLSNIMPAQCVKWARAIDAGDLTGMTEGQRFINNAMALYDIASPFIPMAKRAMQLVGVKLEDACTAPFLPLTQAQDTALQALLNKLGVL